MPLPSQKRACHHRAAARRLLSVDQISHVPHNSQDAIDRELQKRSADISQDVQTYDPAVPSNELRKAQLQSNFQFKGGKALPAAGLLGPVDVSTSASASTSVAAAPRAQAARKSISEEEKLFNQIVLEIEDRQQFLAKMAAMGDHSQDQRINKEIEERIRDMDMLDKIIQDQKRSSRLK